jgi:hypothetical protein
MVILKPARFVSLMLGALNLGLAWAHLIEMRPKRTLSGPQWLMTQQIYRDFGKVSRITFPGALLSELLLLVLTRGNRQVTRLTAVSVSCTATTIAIWALCNEPVNREIATWQVDALPVNWSARRDQWEFAHAASAVLHAIGLAAFLGAVLSDRTRGADSVCRDFPVGCGAEAVEHPVRC